MPSPTATLHAAFDPDRFRALGHRLVDRLTGYLNAATGGAKMPVLPQATPEQMSRAWPGRFLPGPSGRFDELMARMVAGSSHLHHPGFVGHQVAPALPVAALSELAVALLNNNLALFETGPSGDAVERRVVEWMTQALGWDARAGGVLSSGGALGNLTALLAARQAKAGSGVWGEGSGARLTVLVSEQAHYSVERAVKVMGWGRHGAVPVPVDEEFRMRRPALEDSLGTATRAGLKVIGVVANACSTATGTYDPLAEIADFCAAHDLWLHVDGAHGAAAVLSERYRYLLGGVERADSLVWDAHKMMLMPLLVTGVLFRDRAAGDGAFDQPALSLLQEGAAEGASDLSRRTLECSKPALGVALYVALTLYGTDAFATYVTGAFDLARGFAAMVRGSEDFELAVEPDANIVCFRFVPPRVGDLDALQARLRRKVVADGAFYLAQVRLAGKLYLRTALMNPFTSESDLESLLGAIRKAEK